MLIFVIRAYLVCAYFDCSHLHLLLLFALIVIVRTYCYCSRFLLMFTLFVFVCVMLIFLLFLVRAYSFVGKLRRTRLTIVESTPEGFEFTIRTPGTPARWRQYDEELCAVWGKLTAAVCEKTVADDGQEEDEAKEKRDEEEKEDNVCDLILEVKNGANGDLFFGGVGGGIDVTVAYLEDMNDCLKLLLLLLAHTFSAKVGVEGRCFKDKLDLLKGRLFTARRLTLRSMILLYLPPWYYLFDL